MIDESNTQLETGLTNEHDEGSKIEDKVLSLSAFLDTIVYIVDGIIVFLEDYSEEMGKIQHQFFGGEEVLNI